MYNGFLNWFIVYNIVVHCAYILPEYERIPVRVRGMLSIRIGHLHGT